MRLVPFAALLAWSAAAQAGDIQGAASASDGDNLNISVRLFGIDAPERDQTCKNAAGVEYACGQMARDALAALVKNKKVRCVTKAHDRNNRPVAICQCGRRRSWRGPCRSGIRHCLSQVFYQVRTERGARES